MKKKINVAELLKDCLKGTKLYSPLFGDCIFREIDNTSNFEIVVEIENGEPRTFDCFGRYFSGFQNSECMLFPSKENRGWSTFQRHFNGGERYANEEKKRNYSTQKNDNTEEIKTLEKLVKPKFKVGDRIVKKNSGCIPMLITKIRYNFYYVDTENSADVLSISEQDNYELVLHKFDINTLVPFESRVLVRDVDYLEWKGAIFERYDGKKFFTIYDLGWNCCIPYKGNEHLLGTTDDCDDFYKTWK